MKYKIYDTSGEWESTHSLIMAALGIPTGGTTAYACIESECLIDNPEHPDYGKYLFPVTVKGRWKCDQFFPDGLVDLDETWWVPPE